MGELAITNLDRIGSPGLRYRPGKHVRINRDVCECGRTFVRMDRGNISRIDPMLIAKGVNLFPSSLESIVRSFPRVPEFRVIVNDISAIDQLVIDVEVTGNNPEEVVQAIEQETSLRSDSSGSQVLSFRLHAIWFFSRFQPIQRKMSHSLPIFRRLV
jgi:phenylacetate-CoA ligase